MTNKRIKELVENQKLNKKALAKEIGIAYNTLLSLLNGESNHKIDIVLKLVDYFGVSLDYILGIDLDNK